LRIYLPFMLRRLIFVCFFLLEGIVCPAQDSTRWAGFCFNVSAFGGKVIKHTEKFHLPIPDLSRGVDVNFQWKTFGRKEWQQRRSYPTVGIAVAYTDYGIDSVYGRCVGLYPNLEIPLITGERLQWIFRIGDGMGFVTRKYQRRAPMDTLNNAISSTVNDYASFMTQLRYRINSHWDVQLGANFSHISNASFSQPNLGINLYGANIGIRYFPVTSSPHRIARTLKPLKDRWLVQGRVGISFGQSNAPLGPTYPVYLGTAYVSRRWISKNKAFAGFDYSYHEQINSFLHNNPLFIEPQGSARQSYKVAALVGNEFLLGRVGVILQVGYYLKQAFQTQGKVYEKIGGQLYLVQKEKGPLKEFFLTGFLKTHLSVAELAEFGFGFGF
jgi:hypothetical protein